MIELPHPDTCVAAIPPAKKCKYTVTNKKRLLNVDPVCERNTNLNITTGVHSF